MNKRFTLVIAGLIATLVFTGCTSNTPAANTTSASAPAEQTTATNSSSTGTDTTAPKKVVIDLKNQKNGCLNCHAPGKTVKEPDGKSKDISLAGEVKLIANHPPVDANATVSTCFACHKSSPENRDKLVTKLHDVHLNSAIFTGKYKQTCSACHDMTNIKGSK